MTAWQKYGNGDGRAQLGEFVEGCGERHVSTPGKVFLLEPGDIHDGEAPTETGFTYRSLYVDPHWLQRELRLLSENAPANTQPGFAQTLAADDALARDYLHAHLADDIGLDTLAAITGTNRFRLSRAFKAAFGMAPHAYLIQLRLSRARHLLAQGNTPAQVAAALGFADQSHLGRWFLRAYGLTPAVYRKRCSNLPD